MNILVTGGCGYIGTVLTKRLLDEGHSVTAFDIMWFGNRLQPHRRLQVVEGDIRQPDTVPMAGIDTIVHLANVSNDPCSDLNPKLSWETNALATMHLVDRALAHKVGHFIYASSGSVYGVKQEPEVTEDLSLVPISDYNKTKMISERVLLSYADRLAVTCIRPATVCGYSPRMRLDLSVNILTMQALERSRITVFGGGQTRPNIHIQDMVDVYLHFLELGERGAGIFNAGFENLSILDIAHRVTRCAPAEVVITEANDPRSYRLNSDKLIATGFEPRRGIDDAIAELKELHGQGILQDADEYYNIRTMKALGDLT